MTEREYNLRKRIDTLTAERDWHKARAKPQRRKGYPARCVYCGDKTKSHGHPATCRCHRDLVDVDPFYSEPFGVAA